MFERFKFLVICVAALAVGMIQVFGVQTGFLCKCTGKATSSITCRAVVCHPASDCPSKANGKTGEKCPGERPHSEVRKQVLLTNASTEFVLPALILTDIPETFQTPCPGALPMASLLVVERPKVPEYASPPMPQLVAETIVMLV